MQLNAKYSTLEGILQALHYIVTDMYIFADNWMKKQSQTKDSKKPKMQNTLYRK